MSLPRRTSRRSFLQGQAAIDALADALPDAESPTAGEPKPPAAYRSQQPSGESAIADSHRPESYLLRIGRRAMACEFEVLLNAGQYADGAELAVEALDLVEQLEDQLTVFRAHSEISRLNGTAHGVDTPVEPRLFGLLAFAHELHCRTGGAYDITSGPLSKVWGFSRRAGQMPRDEGLTEALDRVGSGHLIFDESKRTVRFAKAGVEINLGSIGKGYSLDRCAELLEARGIADFMLHGGLSSILARGSHGGTAGQGWWVGLRDPLRPEQRLGEIRLRNRALATSGSGKQFFYYEGRRYGHILDPRSGRPAEGMLSTTVLAPSAAEADAMSTAFFVMGLDPSLDYCRRHPELGAVLIAAGAKAGSVDIRTIGIDAADWKLLKEGG